MYQTLRRVLQDFPEAFFDLVREPIQQGTGIAIGHPPDSKKLHGLVQGFDPVEFRARTGMTASMFADSAARQAHWAATYHGVADSAIDYLFCHLPTHHLLLGFEVPPWLARACIERGVEFLNLGVSPLRFGRDLYAALRSSSEALQQRIALFCVPDEELRLEAALLGANVRMHTLHMEQGRNYHFENLDNTLLFIGQTPNDASLLAPHGALLRCSDYADTLRALSQGKTLFYKPHPLAPDFAHEECAELQRITGQTPRHCNQNAYQILSSEDSVELVSISSGLLQEAAWFDKKAHLLFQPFIPLAQKGELSGPAYQQLHFKTLLSPGFWHKVLAPQRCAPRLAALPDVAHSHAREVLDHWWDYSKVMTWERRQPYEAFMRGGGAALRQRMDVLERKPQTPIGAVTTHEPVAIAPDSERWRNLDTRHLQELTNTQEAAALFKHSVRMVEIEVSSYCNRKCWFCPNATHDRMSDNKLMPPDMYSSILRQLTSIGYDGVITYSRYNEPLADKMILERIAQARRMLPDAQLHTNTNGDYLDLEYVEQLYAVGLRSLNIQIYLGNKERYDHAKIKAAGDKTLKRVQLPHTLVRDTPGEWYEQRLHYRDMSIRLYGRNFETGGTSRGGEVPIHMDYQRTSPCLIPFWAVYIDHDGSTVPCCNFRSDIPTHADYVIGKLAQQPDLFLQYASRFAANFRASLIKDGVKEGLCSNCHYAEEKPSQEQTVQLAGLLAGKRH